MSRTRSIAFVALLSVAVAAVSFALALQVFDDGKADPPPAPSGLVDTATEPTVGVTSSTSATTTSTAVVTSPGDLDTPAWVAIVASEGSEATAEATARRVAAAGHPGGYLRSDDYASLSGGHWVAYSGPYPDSASANTAVEALEADGFDGAYVRCVGSKKQCNGGDNNDD